MTDNEKMGTNIDTNSRIELKATEEELEQCLDKGIARIVMTLRRNGVETFESCEGGEGHTFPVPTVRFHGEYAEGFRALSVAIMMELNVRELRRVYGVQTGEVTGPWWELTFSNKYSNNGVSLLADPINKD